MSDKIEKKCKSIFKPALAKKLLKLGHPIVDIKAQKEDINKTVFLFEITEQFEKDLAILQGR